MADSSFILRGAVVLVLGLACVGCGTMPENPSFSLTSARAAVELESMEEAPRPLDRPVVVIDGYFDPGIGSSTVSRRLRKLTPDPQQVVPVNLFWCATFDDARAQIVRAVEARFPSDDPNQTREVDVVGISMGGLAARYAALPADQLAAVAAPPPPTGARPATTPATAPADAPPPTLASAALSAAKRLAAARPAPTKRLRIARLFTLATPHPGAVAAAVPAFLATQRDMRRGSTFLARLNDPRLAATYPIIPYARLADEIVGESYTAPPGQTPIWVPKGMLEASHFGIIMDARVTADIARRLRGESPFATEPRAPLPD